MIVQGQQTQKIGDNMSNDPTAANRSPADDTDKQDVLNEIGVKWNRSTRS